MTTMKVAQLVKRGEPLETSTREIPVATGRDVLVKIEACCLVPNSAQVIKMKPNDRYLLPAMPSVFGLDASGVIAAVGGGVRGLKVGDRVYVDPYLTCGTCHQCRRGRKDLCEFGCLRAYFGLGDSSPGRQKVMDRYPIGGLSQYLLSPDENLAVLPPSIDVNTAARFGYIGTSFGGLKKAGMGPGTTVLINGVTGTLGYAAVAVALGLGCTKILGLGRNKERLAEVASLSTTGRVAVRSVDDEGDVFEWIKEQTKGIGPDALYDCLGNGGDAGMTGKLAGSVRRGGKAILAAGGAEGNLVQPYSEAMDRDVAIVGTVWFNSSEVDDLIALMDSGVIDFSFLKHKFFSLEEINEAFKFVGDRPGGAINVIVQPHA